MWILQKSEISDSDVPLCNSFEADRSSVGPRRFSRPQKNGYYTRRNSRQFGGSPPGAIRSCVPGASWKSPFCKSATLANLEAGAILQSIQNQSECCMLSTALQQNLRRQENPAKSQNWASLWHWPELQRLPPSVKVFIGRGMLSICGFLEVWSRLMSSLSAFCLPPPLGNLV